jgi:hypothetical protein
MRLKEGLQLGSLDGKAGLAACDMQERPKAQAEHISIFSDRSQLAFSKKAIVDLLSSADLRRHIPGFIGVSQSGKLRLAPRFRAGGDFQLPASGWIA